MKSKILLALFIASFVVSAHAQKKQQKTVAYAITAMQKGSSNWTEVRLIDINTGEEVQPVYQSSQEPSILNARTGKPVVKKDVANLKAAVTDNTLAIDAIRRQVVFESINDNNVASFGRGTPGNAPRVFVRRMMHTQPVVQQDKPFSTTSAAIAYDKKHDRLYYTPLGISQLRYIDMKSKETKIYYFEDEQFGALSGRFDVPNQITRMVIAADGNGYALTNNGDHLLKFTTKKKAEIVDLGALNDDPSNGSFSIHSRTGFGGDMVAGESNDLYLITANHAVYKIDVNSKTATYKGAIKGLPYNYSTNGAAVENETSIIVSSAESTLGYYKFDLNTLQAEKISTGESVFNASDLANGNLVNDKKKNDQVTPTQETIAAKSAREDLLKSLQKYKMSIYPNPVTNGTVKITFGDYPQGKYQVQLMDISGKIISTENVTITNKMQLKELKISPMVAKGNYMVKVIGDNKVLSAEQVVVQ